MNLDTNRQEQEFLIPPPLAEAGEEIRWLTFEEVQAITEPNQQPPMGSHPDEPYCGEERRKKLSRPSKDELEKLRTLAFRDELTGLYNRHFLREFMPVELDLAQNNGQCFSLALFDVDYFKRVNDKLGHQSGDRVLMNLSSLLKKSLRKGCTAIRWGGDEFMVLFPGVDVETAFKVMDRFRDLVSTEMEITISVGLAQADFRDGKLPLSEVEKDLIHRADKSLYVAKKSGRNKCCKWQ